MWLHLHFSKKEMIPECMAQAKIPFDGDSPDATKAIEEVCWCIYNTLCLDYPDDFEVTSFPIILRNNRIGCWDMKTLPFVVVQQNFLEIRNMHHIAGKKTTTLIKAIQPIAEKFKAFDVESDMTSVIGTTIENIHCQLDRYVAVPM